MISTKTKPIVWTIAGSDSGGGAGVQADLQAINNLGGHGCSVMTAVTAQNTRGVSAIEPVSAHLVREQIESLSCDLAPRAVKTGMLYNADITRLVAEKMRSISSPLVLDPVMIASSGDTLMHNDFIDVLFEQLIPQATVITPNLIETELLSGVKFSSKESYQLDSEIEHAARKLVFMGAKAVVIKGGDRPDSTGFSQDYFFDGVKGFWLTSKRFGSETYHGTGCSFAAAIACALGNGHSLCDALVIAKTYINQAIESAYKMGAGAHNLAHSAFNPRQDYFPWITNKASEGRNRPEFASCIENLPLGFYPIVDNIELFEKLLQLGVRTIQLRIKNQPQDILEAHIKRAVILTNKTNCRFFLNDYWKLAIKYGAYGVHLGQEDLVEADINAIADAGLKLGVSTHCHEEVARALAVRPSYMAIGPVFATTTKKMTFAPQGVDGFLYWRNILDYPLVAIGGMFLHNASTLIEAGADSIAVVRDIACKGDLQNKVESWLAKF